MSGTLIRSGAYGGGSFYLDVYDASGTLLKKLEEAEGFGTTVEPLAVKTYTNTTGQVQDIWLGGRATSRSADVVMTFQVTSSQSQLSLFLDVDGDFDLANPLGTSDWDTYVPGSLPNGASVPVPDIAGGNSQDVYVIAAFTDQTSGTVVSPPAGVTEIIFELQNSSAFTGYAMNAGTDTGPDFILVGGPSVAFVGSVALIELVAMDYGGFTTIHAEASGTSYEQTMAIPLDANNNWLPDGGWVTTNGPVLDAGANDDDYDSRPTAQSGSAGGPAGGIEGDGLTRFEEYRGFVVRGVHRRTDPDVKDLFASSLVELGQTSFGVGFFAPTAFPPGAGMDVHRVIGLDESASPEYFVSESDPSRALVINANYENGGVGGNIPGHFDQKALRIAVNNNLVDSQGMPLEGGTFIDPASCQPPPAGSGGGTPNETLLPGIEINLDRHQDLAVMHNNSLEELENEIRRTITHELAHGIHVKHRNSTGPQCDDNVNPGTGPSVMDLQWHNGPSATDPRSQFNAVDIPQMRLHLRP